MRLVALIKSARVRALLSLGMVLGLGAVGTLAAWSTTTTTTSGLFTTGTVDIKLDDKQGTSADPYIITFATPISLLPGQTLAAILPVKNAGSMVFTYTIAAAGTGDLGTSLQLVVRADGSSVTNNTCSGTGTSVIANTTLTGADTVLGNRSNTAVGGTDNLCLQFTLSTAAFNTMQGKTGNVRLTFLATSV